MFGDYIAKTENYYLYDDKNDSKIFTGDMIKKLEYSGIGSRQLFLINDGVILDITKRQVSIQDENGITDINISDIFSIEGVVRGKELLSESEEEIDYE